ncbi:MAG TPA: AIR synthase related protein, partial [Planctomycetia bacterium]|nr:AIR synthase related protein [Planctomycetia bacterium]
MPNANGTLWEVEIKVREGFLDPERLRTADALAPLAAAVESRHDRALPTFNPSRGYLVESAAGEAAVRRAAENLLADPVVESVAVAPAFSAPRQANVLSVLRKPGVMDPVATSAAAALAAAECPAASVRTFRRWDFAADSQPDMLRYLARAALANDAVEQAVFGPWKEEHVALGAGYRFRRIEVPIRGMDDAALAKLSKEGQLYLNLEEMRTIRDHFKSQGREATDVELETIAQTWSEHCSHKTLRGPYEFNGVRGPGGLLKDTIFHATKKLAKDWCVSVFADNAGIIKFDDRWNVCFKVETHNHPSAIEPYGGSNTGLGGVIRDILGAGLGAKPICNTDVFCVAPPDTPAATLPDGVLHPDRV